MNIKDLVAVLLLAIALSMDAFAVSISNGLSCRDINKKRMFLIALTFGVFQALMPLIGYFIIELVTVIVGSSGGVQAGEILSITVAWVAFGLLMFLGSKMIVEGIKEYRKAPEEKEMKCFLYQEILIMGVATSIDALAAGVTLHTGMSNNVTVWLHAFIILSVTFIICILGLFLAKQIAKIFKNKTEIATIDGGIILILLAIWVILSHYLPL